jgi:hypothetical protein
MMRTHSLNRGLSRPIHWLLIRLSPVYRDRYLESKRLALGCRGALPARYAQLPPLLSQDFCSWVKSL